MIEADDWGDYVKYKDAHKTITDLEQKVEQYEKAHNNLRKMYLELNDRSQEGIDEIKKLKEENKQLRKAIENITEEMTDPDRIPDNIADKVFKIAYTALNGKYEKEGE